MMPSAGLFVTGTDTGIGKTRVALGLLAALQSCGLSAVGMKPVAAGCVRTDAGLRNEDALLLQRSGSFPVAYDVLNPYAFEPAVSPHIAAARSGICVDLERIAQAFDALASGADRVVVEGAGGWYAPLGETITMADLAKRLGLPVVLVAGIRLGGLNHAVLTARAIARDGLNLAGWVANHAGPPMAEAPENVEYLRRQIEAPLVGIVPHQPDASADQTARHLDPGSLL